MELSITVGALIAGVALVAAMRLREGRSRTSLNVPLLPTTPVMFIGMIMILLAGIHLLGLFGFGGR
jgi:membrane associated rhomboid family serine protease